MPNGAGKVRSGKLRKFLFIVGLCVCIALAYPVAIFVSSFTTAFVSSFITSFVSAFKKAQNK